MRGVQYGLDEIVYTLDEWTPTVLAEVATKLRLADVQHSWDGVRLTIPKVEEARTDRILDEVEQDHPFENNLHASTGSDISSGTMRCPYCAESIRREALICKHCGARADAAGWVPARAATPTGTSGFAIASLVLGILWMWTIGSVLALVFGYKAKSDIRGSGGALNGDGMATAGIALGWIGVIVTVCVGLLLVAASANP